jgi:hypothetical protein
MWNAKTKTDLAIEVWEKLDCEDVGASEIEAIETVIREEYGQQAVDSPMIIARLLADEGAVLRHSEIMELYLARASNRPYVAAFRNILNIADLDSALTSIKNLDSLRRKYLIDGDREGLRLVREVAISAKDQAAETAGRNVVEGRERAARAEIAEWFRVWLQTPDLFDNWVELRRSTPDYKQKFVGQEGDN